MPLSMTTRFEETDISELIEIKADKIWLIKGHQVGNELILKAELLKGDNKLDAKVVKAIDPLGRMKELDDRERGILRKLCATQYNLVVPGFLDKQRLAKLIQNLGTNMAFFKMEKQIVLGLDAMVLQQCNGNGQPLREFTSFLIAKGGLEKFGAIVAGDLFNGNTDRFSFGCLKPYAGPYYGKVGNLSYSLQCIVNLGNVVIAGYQGTYSPSMLDYLDPSNLFKSGVRLLKDVETRENPWGGRTLLKRSSRKDAAKLLVADLETMLHPNPGSKPTKSPFGWGAKGRIEAGMVQGIQKIIEAWKFKVGSMQNKPGLVERFDLICQYEK